MPDIDADDVPAAYNEVAEHHINWNTHGKLREFFGYSPEPELFGRWLELFYELAPEERTTLRQRELYLVNPSDFPTLNQRSSS